jgi:hypothetical protein
VRRVYDPKRDGCPFAWIVLHTATIRAERQATIDARNTAYRAAWEKRAARLRSADEKASDPRLTAARLARLRSGR